MIDLQTEMNRLVSGFVTQVTDIAKRAVIDSIGTALGGGRDHQPRAKPSGGKRTAEALDRLSTAFVTFVAKHPGLRIEQINKELGTKTKDLALPIRKLLADGAIKTKGKKRSTTYFAK